MYDLLLPPGLRGLRCFAAQFEFLDNFIQIWIKFGYEEKWNRVPYTQVYFQGVWINVLWIAFLLKKNIIGHFRLYLKQYWAWQICVIAHKSVTEALNISSELQFSTDQRWHAPTCSNYLLLLFHQNESIY